MYNLSLDGKDLQQQKSPCEISKEQLFQYLAFQFEHHAAHKILKYMCFCFDNFNISLNYYSVLGDVGYEISPHCHAGLRKSV